MKKPELVIDSAPADNFVSGYCSSCPQVKFRLSGNLLQQKIVIRGMFDAHLRLQHMHEDGSQAAARSAKEATKD